MSSRKNVVFYPVATAQSMAATFTTPATIITHLDNVTYEIICTSGGSIGTYSVQVSNDYTVDPPTNTITNAGNWTPLTLSTPLVSTGTGDNMVVSLNQLAFNAVRLAYVSAVAGTSTCSITIGCKLI